jgi:hypothetical protein
MEATGLQIYPRGGAPNHLGLVEGLGHGLQIYPRGGAPNHLGLVALVEGLGHVFFQVLCLF